MDNLIELVTFIGAGILGVFLLRVLKPDVKKQNTEVIVKIDKLEKANEKLETKIEANTTQVNKEIDVLEQEKNKDLSAEGLADFFDKRK